MNTFQSQTLWIFSDSKQCLNQAWSVLQYSPGTLIVTGLNVGGCITRFDTMSINTIALKYLPDGNLYTAN